MGKKKKGAALVLHQGGDVDEVANGLPVKAGGEQVGALVVVAPGRGEDGLPVALRNAQQRT